MFKMKSFKKAEVVNAGSYRKVVRTTYGNIVSGMGLIYPTALCLSSQGVHRGTSLLGSDYVSCYTTGWKSRNICRKGCRYELDAMAPMNKRMNPEDIVYFEVWRDSEDWDLY